MIHAMGDRKFETLDEFFEWGCALSQKVYEQFKHHNAMILPFLDGSLKCAIDLTPVIGSDRDKLIALEFFNEKFLKDGIEAYLMISEAWMASMDPKAYKPGMRAGTQANRIEVLHIILDCPEYQRIRSYKIAKGKVLGLQIETDTRQGGKRNTGLMTNLWSPEWKKENL